MLIKLNQLYWKEHDPVYLPILVNTDYIQFAVEDEVLNKYTIIGVDKIMKCVAIMIEGDEKPLLVRETIGEITAMVNLGIPEQK